MFRGTYVRHALKFFSWLTVRSIREEKVAQAIGGEDKEKIEKTLHEAMEWLDANQQAEVEEYEHKLKELEDLCNPIITRMYQGAGGAPPPGAGGAAPEGAGGPVVLNNVYLPSALSRHKEEVLLHARSLCLLPPSALCSAGGPKIEEVD
eukprot:scaffold167122_cov19-Tisochrysis_lutea.AAC.1